MLKKFIFCMCSIGIISILFFGATVFAAPICPVPVEFTQPNGDVITVTSYGDEFFSWQEDENGNIITYDEESNSYKYAEIKDGKIISTPHIVGGISLFSAFSHKIQREDIEPLWENAERVDYSKSGNDGIQLMSADDKMSGKQPLTDQKLFTILIEFKDIPIKYGVDYWHDKMYDKTNGVHSVVNYWQENANGRDVFKPAVTEGIKKGDKGTVSYKDYTDINYEIKECRDGVVQVYLDMPHPVKNWSSSEGPKVNSTANLALRAIEKNFDFKGEKPHLVTIFAGYEGLQGKGEGQISAYTQIGGQQISDGTVLSCLYVGERYLAEPEIPTGIGTICHELGHSVFGLPDLYPLYGFPGENDGIHAYSLMSIGCWGQRCNPDDPNDNYDTPYEGYLGHVPSHLDPWSKIRCGFIIPEIVNDWDGDINSISPDGENSKYNVIKIISKTDPTQYFLVENRQLIGFDKGLEMVNGCARGKANIDGGIIIWHIDENVSFNNNNDKKYHHFMQIEPSNNIVYSDLSVSEWRYTNKEGYNKFNAETAPNSNLHERVTDVNYECSWLDVCHPQTCLSGVSIEVLGDNSTSTRVKAKVDDEYVIDFADKKFSEVFPDENVCEAFLGIVEKNSGVRKTPDSIISLEDAIIIMSIKDLNLNDRGIKDLRGIEQLPILEWLRLERNELTKLDTNKFPNLIALFCNDNKIKELDVSNMEKLMYLDCSNNLLTKIDTSKNINLSNLWCSNNLLTELNISQNKYLSGLWCSGNMLKELNTDNNDELWELYCYNNKLKKLDITNNKELITIQCYDNYMDQNPETAIKSSLELQSQLGDVSTKDDKNENYRFIYYPQKTAEPTPIPKTGDRVELEQTGNVVTATLIFEETKPPKQDDIWIIVAYKKDGVLKSAEVPQLVDMTASFIIPKAFEDCEISAYVWDKDMKSIMGVQKIK